jgi:hypothetical protein
MTLDLPTQPCTRAAVGAAAAVAALVALLVVASGAAAQEVRGVALDPQGDPLPNVVVALHRVGDMGAGANVASVTTDAAGRFQFQVEEPDSALYFAAMRYGGSMYIGPPAMAGVQRVDDYILMAEPAAEAGAVASALSREPGMGGGMMGAAAQAPRTGTGGQGRTDMALAAVALLALVAAGLFVTTAPRYRRRRTRDTLLEVATLENRLAEEPEPEDREDLEHRRDQLRSRLAPSA